MAWYYKDAGANTAGPVGKAQLQQLIKAGQINGQTLVRNDKITNWRPLSDMVRGKSTPGQAPPPPPQEHPAAQDPEPFPDNQQPAVVPPTSVCSQCGRSVPQDQVVTYDDQVICAACKPIVVQKMKEGVAICGALSYAGFWIRFVAKFIDGIIMAVVQWLLLIPLGIMTMGAYSPTSGELPSGGFLMAAGLQQLVSIIIPAVYNTFFVGRFGATPGKMACRLNVVQPDGGKVSYMRALGRNFAEWISAIILGIGYLMAAFDSEKRSLHDRVCGTRVVYKS